MAATLVPLSTDHNADWFIDIDIDIDINIDIDIDIDILQDFSQQDLPGKHSIQPTEFPVSRNIKGTSITTYNCFVEPDAPVDVSKENGKCLVNWNPLLPTLFVEGDSIAHSLIPMLELLHENRRYNISFFGRGGCITPFVKPWPHNRYLLPRFQA